MNQTDFQWANSKEIKAHCLNSGTGSVRFDGTIDQLKSNFNSDKYQRNARFYYNNSCLFGKTYLLHFLGHHQRYH